MENRIIIRLILLIANILWACYNYSKENYKTSMFFSFASGVLFISILQSVEQLD